MPTPETAMMVVLLAPVAMIPVAFVGFLLHVLTR